MTRNLVLVLVATLFVMAIYQGFVDPVVKELMEGLNNPWLTR